MPNQAPQKEQKWNEVEPERFWQEECINGWVEILQASWESSPFNWMGWLGGTLWFSCGSVSFGQVPAGAHL